MKIYPPGTDVTITQAGAIGKVSQIVIGYNDVTYNVVYYIDGVRQVVSCSEQELMVQSDMKKIVVGFK